MSLSDGLSVWRDLAGRLFTGRNGTIPLHPASFRPIDDAARDGARRLVKRGDDYAAAYWTGAFWAYAGVDERRPANLPAGARLRRGPRRRMR